MPVGKNDNKRIAGLARLNPAPPETSKFLLKMKKIIDYTGRNTDMTGEIPAQKYFSLLFARNLLKEISKKLFTLDIALNNAPETGDNLFTVTRVIGK